MTKTINDESQINVGNISTILAISVLESLAENVEVA